jgi:hypothetical protein
MAIAVLGVTWSSPKHWCSSAQQVVCIRADIDLVQVAVVKPRLSAHTGRRQPTLRYAPRPGPHRRSRGSINDLRMDGAEFVQPLPRSGPCVLLISVRASWADSRATIKELT